MSNLTRKQIRQVFSQNRGAAAELARLLGISPVTVHHWLHGRIQSERIAIAATEMATLLREESVHA